MSRLGQIRRRDWSDLAVVFGPNMRYVEEDYADLMQHAPEVLLGYRVMLATSQTNIRGLRVQKLVILDAEYGMWDRAWIADARACLNFGTKAKVERYRV